MKTVSVLWLFTIAVFIGIPAIASKKDNNKDKSSSLSSISGVILDKGSKEKLAGVTICLTSTNQKIFTNSRGEFSFDGIEPGTYKLKVNCISYKDQEISVTVTKPQGGKTKILLSPVEP